MDSLLLDPPKAYLRYLDMPGDDPPIVWIHGLGGASSADFPPVAANAVLNGRRSIVVDLFGHGYSDAPDEFSYALEDHADCVARLLDYLSAKDCAVFGHSMGGSVAITLGAVRPDLVANLIVAEGNLDPGGGIVSAGIAGQTESGFVTAGHAALLEQIFEDFGDPRTQTLRAASPVGLYRTAVGLVKGTEPTMRERIYKLPIPRAYVFGERGLPDPETEQLASHGVPVLVVPDAGHDMPLDNPAGLAHTVAEALRLAG
jgi:pimeloyl-ACP methyl ester carboxylesterase